MEAHHAAFCSAVQLASRGCDNIFPDFALPYYQGIDCGMPVDRPYCDELPDILARNDSQYF